MAELIGKVWLLGFPALLLVALVFLKMPNSKLKCRQCKEYFPREQIRSHPNNFCCIDHAVEWAAEKGKKAVAKQRRKESIEAKKKAKQEAAIEREERKERKLLLKPLGRLCSEAQKDVNAMILAVDRLYNRQCISSGNESEHAGHYHHAGTKYRISWLRFLPSNIHGQSAESNTHKSGEAHEYRVGLIDRYGQDYFDDLEEFKRLEDCGMIKAPTKEEVIAMAKWCRAMTRIYKKMHSDS